MKLREKYCLDSERLKPENKDKISISDDFYVLCETLERITDKMIRVRE